MGRFLWVVGALVLAGVNARAASTTLTAVADTTISEFNQAALHGAGGGDGTMIVGRLTGNGQNARNRDLLRFNLSSIPANSVVTSATLTVFITKSHIFGAVDVHAVHRMTTAWTEAGATWDSSGSAPWSGGSFDGAADSTVGISSGSATFPSTSATVATVQMWVSNPGLNNGWILLNQDEETLGNARRISSREAASGRPTLTVQYTAAPVNNAPVASNDVYTTAEDIALTNNAPGVLANDTDADGNPLTAVLVSGPTHGTLNLSTNGAFIYTPSLNYTGADTFTYRASDGTLTSAVATVTFTITPVNDPPAASNDTYTAAANTVLTNAAPGVLANDSDSDGNTLSAVLVTGPTNGTLNLNSNGAFAYTPNLNYSGPDSFTYRASDGALTSSVATVTITITAPPPQPRLAASRIETNSFIFSFVGETGHTYTVEFKNDLNATNWTTKIIFPAPAQQTNFTVQDALAGKSFFRVKVD